MCVYIGIEDVAANALIALLTRDQACRQVLFTALGEYGEFVVQKYRRNTNEDAILIRSRERRRMFFEDYSEFFEPLDKDGECVGVKLRDGVDVNALKRFFRYNMTVHLVEVFIDQEALNVLYRKVA